MKYGKIPLFLIGISLVGSYKLSAQKENTCPNPSDFNWQSPPMCLENEGQCIYFATAGKNLLEVHSSQMPALTKVITSTSQEGSCSYEVTTKDGKKYTIKTKSLK